VRVWDAATGRLRRDFYGPMWQGVAVAFHPSLPRLYSAGGGNIKEWNLDRRDAVMDEATAAVRAIAISQDGRFMAAGLADGTVRTYDATSGRLLHSMSGHSASVNAVAFGPDSTLVASGSSDKTIKLWNVSSGHLARTLTGHTDTVSSVAFTPNGQRIVSGSEDYTIRVWSLLFDGPMATIPEGSPIGRVGVSPDGRTILAMRNWDKSISLWDAETKRRSGVLDTDTPENNISLPRCFALSQDGGVLVGPADLGLAIAIWDFPKRRLKQILRVFQSNDQIASLAISPDGSRLAVGGYSSGSVSVWDLRRRKPLVTLGGHNGGVLSLAWTPDSTRLVSASEDRTIRVWDSRSPYNYDAELLLDELYEPCLLAEEMVPELDAVHSIPDALRKEAIRLAMQRGNAPYDLLIYKAWQTGAASGRTAEEYAKALRRATVAAQVAPWYGRAHLTLGLLQYRTGDWQQALASAQRAIEILKAQAPEAHAIRAMAYFRLHDAAQAKKEVALGRQAARQEQPPQDHKLLQEAEALVSGTHGAK
jgi:WD40 repeat protein